MLVAQPCPTLWDPVDCSLPGSSVHGIFLTRILERVAISSSRGSSRLRDRTHVSCVSCNAGRFFYCWAIGDLPACAWKNPTIRGAWWATVHGVPKSQTQLSDLLFLYIPAGMCSGLLLLLSVFSNLQNTSIFYCSTINAFKHYMVKKKITILIKNWSISLDQKLILECVCVCIHAQCWRWARLQNQNK